MPSRFSVIFVFVDASAAARVWISANGNPVGKARGITRGSDVVFTTGTRCDAPRHLLHVCSLVWSLSALHLTLICLASARRVCPISRVYVQGSRDTPARDFSARLWFGLFVKVRGEHARLSHASEVKSLEKSIFDYYPIVTASRSFRFDK